MKRKALSKKVRFEIFKRDNFTCQYCGKIPPNTVLEIDHIIPVKKNGTNEMFNLVTSCFDCNRGKSANSLSNLPQNQAERLKLEKERYEQAEILNKFLIQKRKNFENKIVAIGCYWFNQFCKQGEENKFIFGTKRQISIRSFLKYLLEHEIYEAIDIAMGKFYPKHNDNKTWLYFCGICWRMIRRKQGVEQWQEQE